MAFLHGSNVIPDIVAIIGVLFFGAGMHLLWQSRHEFFSWVVEFVRMFQSNLQQRANTTGAVGAVPEELPRRKHAVRIVVGLLLAFVLAPLLITIGLAF